ncbi:MAG: fructose-bisphosphate aldolase, partial [Bartonella sp.]|nr:fructose-bisphosphate aldolase [Bartonella sp.]
MSERLEDIAVSLVRPGKGILAADESTATIGKRFQTIGVESTEDNRRAYREMLFSAKEAMEMAISGVILFDETIRQKASTGQMLTDLIRHTGAVPGIKVDTGAKP